MPDPTGSPQPPSPLTFPPIPPTSASTFADLLQQLDLLAYAAVLDDEEIRTGDDLRNLTADDLKEMGFKIGARNRVLKWSAGP